MCGKYKTAKVEECFAWRFALDPVLFSMTQIIYKGYLLPGSRSRTLKGIIGIQGDSEKFEKRKKRLNPLQINYKENIWLE